MIAVARGFSGLYMLFNEWNPIAKANARASLDSNPLISVTFHTYQPLSELSEDVLF